MTVSTTGGGGVVAPYDPNDFGNIGLEDVSAADIAIPRLQIVHKEGKFKDSLSGQVFDTGLKVILLGLVKQRVFWKDDTDEGDMPLCKSPNFDHGFPLTDPEVPASKQFPWDKSNFEKGSAQPITLGASQSYPEGWTSNGLGVLPCSQCIFKEWDKGDWKQPPCAEQHTYPLLYSVDDWETSQPALYTVQKTGIKPSRTYMSAFAQAKQPFFSVFTQLDLTLMKRGTVDYSVPRFSRLEATDRNDWLEYANQMRSIREFVRSAPRRFDEEGGDAAPAAPSANVNTAPPTPAPAPAATATTTAAPAAAAAPTPPATPAAPPVSTPTAPAPSAPSPSPASAPAAAPANDDLPF